MGQQEARATSRPRPVTLELCLPPDQQAPSAARHAVSGLHVYLRPELRDTLELLVSELVTNSVLHGGLGPGDWIVVDVSSDGSGVRVAVRDPGRGLDRDRDVTKPEPGAVGGWGLVLVDRLATRWGISPGVASEVWFELEPAAEAEFDPTD
jgi:anti-sigma regulatory factor (Ser/Thr protein kinase)